MGTRNWDSFCQNHQAESSWKNPKKLWADGKIESGLLYCGRKIKSSSGGGSYKTKETTDSDVFEFGCNENWPE